MGFINYLLKIYNIKEKYYVNFLWQSRKWLEVICFGAHGARLWILLVDQPVYSPHLAPYDNYLSSKTKNKKNKTRLRSNITMEVT